MTRRRSTASRPAAALAAGSHTCAVLATGGVLWGDNSFGQLGNGTANPTTIPCVLTCISTARAVAPGTGHSCVVLAKPREVLGRERRWASLGDVLPTRRCTGHSQRHHQATDVGPERSIPAPADRRLHAMLGQKRFGQLGDGRP